LRNDLSGSHGWNGSGAADDYGKSKNGGSNDIIQFIETSHFVLQDEIKPELERHLRNNPHILAKKWPDDAILRHSNVFYHVDCKTSLVYHRESLFWEGAKTLPIGENGILLIALFSEYKPSRIAG
jgi:hypothetical protein